MEGPSEAGSVWAGVELPLRMHIEEVKHLEKKWRLENMIPAWMDYPDEISSEEEDCHCEEEEVEEEEEEEEEEGEEEEEEGEDEEYSEEEVEEEEEEEEGEEEEEEYSEEEGKNAREEEGRKAREEEWRKECEEELMKASEDYQWVDIDELKMRKKMCIAWIVARMDLEKMTRELKWDSEGIISTIDDGRDRDDSLDTLITQQSRREIQNVLQGLPKVEFQEEREMMWNFDHIKLLVFSPQARERRETMRREWRVVSADENLRAGWKVDEMERFTEIRMMMWVKKASEVEQSHAMRRQLNEAELKKVLMRANPSYLAFRNRWMEIHSCWGGVFEHITPIRPMRYSSDPVPQYMYNNALPDTLQVISVKVEGITGSWPCNIFGLVAIRDSVDQRRNMIFNRTEYDCQIITAKDPYLVLTGPTRAVVMNEEAIPVTIEAELKLKTIAGDKHFVFAAAPLPSSFYSGVLCLMCGIMKLKIELVRVETSVEATIFTRVVTNGTWPDGYNGQLTAQTSNIQEKIVLAEFQGDGPVTVNGGYVDQNRFVVPVEAYKELVVSCDAWRGVQTMQGELTFMSEKKGRSWGTLVVGPCIFEVLVVWSPIRPVCEELVSMSQMKFVE